MNEVILVKNRSRIAACMLLIRNNLSNENKKVISVLAETKHDKEKTYNKIVAMMLDNCYSKIDQATIEKVLKPESLDKWDESYEKLLEFNKNVFQIIGPELKFSNRESFILDEISKVTSNPGIDIPSEEVKNDIFTEILGKNKYIALGMLCGFSITFVIILINIFVPKKK